jgi:sulfite oxidase
MNRQPVRPPATLTRRALLQCGAGAVGLLAIGSSRLCSAAEPAAQPALRDGKQLVVLSADPPLNAEPQLDKLVADWITPIEQFYVRSHGSSPEVDAAGYRLSIAGLVEKPLSLALGELRETFAARTAAATLTCAGNRRAEHSRIKPVEGVQWGAGAIGNARWTGVRLADVLTAAGMREGAKHVWFEGVDEVKQGGGVIPFGASIPLERAMQAGEGAEVLLAHAMNERPLPRDHGFPLRTIVPGYIGARSVKWLTRIVVSDRPSDNHFVSHAYKLVKENTEEAWAAAEPIGEFALNSVICRPPQGAKVGAGKLTVAGYALPQGTAGRTIARVELSTDGGKAWLAADITSQNRAFCWCLWRGEVPVAADTTSLLVRAVDSAGVAQPEKIDWNLKGYMHNAWHQVELE